MAGTRVSVRRLLRDSTAVLDSLGSDGPVLLTRNGKPIAALVAVDPEQADELVLSTVPEFADSRRLAANAHAEGRTVPVERALARFSREELVAAGATQRDLAEAGIASAGSAEVERESAGTDAAPAALPGALEEEFHQATARIDMLIGTIVHERGRDIVRDLFEQVTNTGTVMQDRRAELARLESFCERLLDVRVRSELARKWAHRPPASGSADVPSSAAGITVTVGEADDFVRSIFFRNAKSSAFAGQVNPEILLARMDASVSTLEHTALAESE